MTTKPNQKPSMTLQDGKQKSEQQLDKVTEQNVDQPERDNNIGAATENIKNDHIEHNTVSDILAEKDIKTSNYACPATPDSVADHNDCVLPSQDTKQIDIAPSS